VRPGLRYLFSERRRHVMELDTGSTGSPIDSGAPAGAFGTFRSLRIISLIMKRCYAVRLIVREGGAMTDLALDCPSTSDSGANSAMAMTVETVTMSLCILNFRGR